MKIQIIDYKDSQASKNVVQSFKDTGFAVLTNHGIPFELFKKVKENWQQFFADNNKLQYMYDKNAIPQAGYFPTERAKGESTNDLKEFFHVYKDHILPDIINNSTWQLRESLLNIGIDLLRGIDKYTPEIIKKNFSESLNSMVDKKYYSLFRVIHYQAQNNLNNRNAIRAAAHADINLITILPASDEPGLQALDHNNIWHEIPCNPGMLVINSGDMLQMLSQNYYKSTIHRVRNPKNNHVNKARFSFPMFIHAKSNAIIDPKRNYTANDYLNERLREMGLRNNS